MAGILTVLLLLLAFWLVIGLANGRRESALTPPLTLDLVIAAVGSLLSLAMAIRFLSAAPADGGWLLISLMLLTWFALRLYSLIGQFRRASDLPGRPRGRRRARAHARRSKS